VREADRSVLALDHVRDDGRVERVRRNARARQQRLRCRAQRRGDRERLARRRWQPGEPHAHEVFERLGNRERLKRIGVRLQRAGQFQREERIPAGHLVDAEQCLAGEGSAEPAKQEPVNRADAERPHTQPLDPFRIERPLESRPPRPVDEPSSEQQTHVAARQSSQRERERARRGWVEPLDVVDRDQNRFALAQQVQHVAHRDGQRAGIDGVA
jgi:hypothetical protein